MRRTKRNPENIYRNIDFYNNHRESNDKSTSEIDVSGENFTLELRTGSTIGSGTLVQSSSFNLYDDDLSITVLGTTGTQVDIPNSATNAYVYATFSSSGDTAVAGRIKDSSGTVVRSGFNLNTQGINTTILVTSGLPNGIGSTSTTTGNYTLEVHTPETLGCQLRSPLDDYPRRFDIK